MLDAHLRQAKTELAFLRHMQESAAAYRHDMRHHIAHLQRLASEKRLEEIKEYLETAHADIDSITPKRLCDNETVNLIVSSFAAKAEQAEIKFTVDINLADILPFSDTEICSLLSNALENAMQTAKNIEDRSKRHIKLRMYSKNRKLCLDIRNRYETEPVFKNNLPVSEKENHGIGTRSMVHIVEKYGGTCRFSVQDGWFIFQATG